MIKRFFLLVSKYYLSIVSPHVLLDNGSTTVIELTSNMFKQLGVTARYTDDQIKWRCIDVLKVSYIFIIIIFHWLVMFIYSFYIVMKFIYWIWVVIFSCHWSNNYSNRAHSLEKWNNCWRRCWQKSDMPTKHVHFRIYCLRNCNVI